MDEFQRAARGRFAKGNRGGRGGAPRKVNTLRKALLGAVTVEDLKLIVAGMIGMAKAGDVDAAKLVLSYGVGSPDRVHDAVQLEARESILQGPSMQPTQPAKIG